MATVVNLREPVVCQRWMESSSGGQWLDGYSLHASLNCLERYVERHWDSLPDDAPAVYERPEGEPYVAGVSRAIAEKVKESGDGVRVYSLDYPIKMARGEMPVQPERANSN